MTARKAAKRGKKAPAEPARQMNQSDQDPRTGLNPRQQRFVAEYLVDLNATQAAIRAGYSAKTADQQASRLLANISVAAAVQKAMDERAERTQLTADEILTGITRTISRCEQASPVLDRGGNHVLVKTPNGELAAAYVFDAKNVLRGYELLGKHLKMFTDRIEHTGKDGERLIPAEMTPEQRREEIKRLLAENPGLAVAGP